VCKVVDIICHDCVITMLDNDVFSCKLCIMSDTTCTFQSLMIQGDLENRAIWQLSRMNQDIDPVLIFFLSLHYYQ